MPFLPAFLLTAQGATAQSVEVKLSHQRPSRIARFLTDLYHDHLLVTSHDLEGTLTLLGTPDVVESARSSVSLFDVQPRTVRLRVRVESPLDHAEWKADLTLTNNRRWSGNDEGTGVSLSISPRANADGTVTLSVESKSADTAKNSVVVRIKPNAPMKLDVPVGTVRVWSKTEPKGPCISLTLEYQGD